MSDIQALPTQFENTASTWQNMPAMAAMYTGQQNAIAQQNNAALQNAFASEQAYKAQERPVTLKNLMSTGELTSAQARGADALARFHNLDSDLKAGTLTSDIQTKLAEGAAKRSEAQVSTDIDTGYFISNLARRMQQVPPTDPMDKVNRARTIMKLMGVPDDKEGKNITHILQNYDEAVKALAAEGEHRVMSSQKGVLTGAALTTKENIAKETTTRAEAVARETTNRNVQTKILENANKLEVAHQKAIDSSKDSYTALMNDARKAKDPAAAKALTDAANAAKAQVEFLTRLQTDAKNATGLVVSNLIDPEGKLNVKPAMPASPQFPVPTPAAPASAAPVPPGAVVPASDTPMTNALPPAGGVPANPKAPAWNSPEGDAWVQRAKKANPGMNEIDIIQNGRHLGKIS